ncbi:MAG: hypothetical protein LBM95_09025 [Lactobacillales bacterium]|nr:hypothetical protein [Lactobacillales bacterium]
MNRVVEHNGKYHHLKIEKLFDVDGGENLQDWLNWLCLVSDTVEMQRNFYH